MLKNSGAKVAVWVGKQMAIWSDIIALYIFLCAQINHQLDATVFPVFYLTFLYSSTCFGRPQAHHQELNNCSSSLWFYRRSLVIAVLLVVVGPVGPTTTNSTAITKLRR